MTKRNQCSVCECDGREILVRQPLELPAEQCTYSGYDIVACARCGFIYADTSLDQRALDAHYEAPTYRFAHDVATSADSDVDVARSRACATSLVPLLPPDATVMDVGCGTGMLLSMFHEMGFKCRGIDQSPVAAAAGMKKYGVQIEVGSVFDLPAGQEFDLVITSHVLEHIVDLSAFLRCMWNLAKPQGLLYVEVPNAGDFLRFADPQSPGDWMYLRDLYTHFTPEHVNFFSLVSLRNLMHRYGFDEVRCEAHPLGVIASLWTRRTIVSDTTTAQEVMAYTAASRRIQQSALDKIRELVQTGDPILVWGAGLHTQRLLAGELMGANIEAFIDSDAAYQGTTLAGKPIVAPGTVSVGLPILVSSYRSEAKIVQYARSAGIQNRMITLYT
jgi:2-polyprenyl-3-methyl-5-hydroxy-6-metoxy-1,4-benzoquinol methylase